MTKAELLQDLSSRVLRTISVVEESDEVKNAAGVRMYMANVLNLERGDVRGQNVGFYVIDEGQPEEQAYYRDKAGSKLALQAETVAFIATLPYEKVQILEIDDDNEFVIARAFKATGDGAAMNEVKLMLYKDKTGTATCKEIA